MCKSIKCKQTKLPSLEIDRDKYEIDLIVESFKGLSLKELKKEYAQAEKERLARMAKASW